MGYSPENNPYIPGDPYSYDLDWMVEEIKKAQQVGENAQASADAALQSQIEAQQAKDLSMAWAIGEDEGGPIPPGEPQYENNSKYYAQQAADSATAAASSEANAAGSALAAQTYSDNIADPVSGIVTNWLADNITQPTTPAIDASLSVAGAAADAKATGDAISDANILLDKQSVNMFDMQWVTGESIRQSDGDFISNSGYSRTDYIPIKAGVVNIGALALSTPARVPTGVAIYDSNHVQTAHYLYNQYPTIYNSGYLYYQQFPVPNDGYMAFYIFTSAEGAQHYVSQESTVDHFDMYYDPFRYADIDYLYDNKMLDSMNYGKKPSQAASAAFNNGDSLVVEQNAIMKNQKIVFFGKVTSFDTLYIGHGQSSYGYYVKVDNTNMTYMSNGSPGTSVAHGLTISDFICIMFELDVHLNLTVRIITAGGSFSRTQQINLSVRQDIFCLNENSTITDAVLTWESEDYKKPIWAFGDSYFTLYSPARWPYYFTQAWNMDNMLLDAYPGEDSTTALADLKNALQHGTPKYLLWTLGMNNPDTINTPNLTWMTNSYEVIKLCEERNIELVFCTVPNVTNASYRNVNKNTWIANSGYRYVDLAGAVSGVPGWLSADGVHPSELGARLLASALIAGFPEIIQIP